MFPIYPRVGKEFCRDNKDRNRGNVLVKVNFVMLQSLQSRTWNLRFGDTIAALRGNVQLIRTAKVIYKAPSAARCMRYTANSQGEK